MYLGIYRFQCSALIQHSSTQCTLLNKSPCQWLGIRTWSIAFPLDYVYSM